MGVAGRLEDESYLVAKCGGGGGTLLPAKGLGFSTFCVLSFSESFMSFFDVVVSLIEFICGILSIKRRLCQED